MPKEKRPSTKCFGVRVIPDTAQKKQREPADYEMILQGTLVEICVGSRRKRTPKKPRKKA